MEGAAFIHDAYTHTYAQHDGTVTVTVEESNKRIKLIILYASKFCLITIKHSAVLLCMQIRHG